MDTTAQLTTNNYSKGYKDDCFYLWWELGRPAWTDLALQVNRFQGRIRPGVGTLSTWAKNDGWVDRADTMDKSLQEELTSRYITAKAEMMARHVEVGRSITDMGMEFLESNPISSQAAALRAIQLGVTIETEAAQIEKLLSTVAKMDDSKVQAELRKYLDKAKLKKKTTNANGNETERA